MESIETEPRADCSSGVVVGRLGKWDDGGSLFCTLLVRVFGRVGWESVGVVRVIIYCHVVVAVLSVCSSRLTSSPVRSQRDGKGQLRSHRDGSGPVRSQRDGSGPVRFQRDDSCPVRSQRDNSGLVRSRKDGSGPVRSQTDGSGPVRSRKDGSGPVRSQTDGSGPVRSQRDGSGPVRSQRDGSGPVRSQRDGSGPEHSQQDGSAHPPGTSHSNAPSAAISLLTSSCLSSASSPSESPPSLAAPPDLSVSPSAAAGCDDQVSRMGRHSQRGAGCSSSTGPTTQARSPSGSEGPEGGKGVTGVGGSAEGKRLPITWSQDSLQLCLGCAAQCPQLRLNCATHSSARFSPSSHHPKRPLTRPPPPSLTWSQDSLQLKRIGIQPTWHGLLQSYCGTCPPCRPTASHAFTCSSAATELWNRSAPICRPLLLSAVGSPSFRFPLIPIVTATPRSRNGRFSARHVRTAWMTWTEHIGGACHVE
ncbi:unnamed protein product [Closterium sp. Naga37s-1]|nr:unnamed protein product [Closterium sp. Naga37s-1]